MEERSVAVDQFRRQCTGTNRSGERCGKPSILGGTVCVMHGGSSPTVKAAARTRLLEMVEPALGALLRCLHTGPPCEHCGRTDADKNPVVVRAAQIVLDRTGFGPSAHLTVTPGVNTSSACVEWMTPEQLAMMDAAFDDATRRMLSGDEKQNDRIGSTIIAAITVTVVDPKDEDQR